MFLLSFVLSTFTALNVVYSFLLFLFWPHTSNIPFVLSWYYLYISREIRCHYFCLLFFQILSLSFYIFYFLSMLKITLSYTWISEMYFCDCIPLLIHLPRYFPFHSIIHIYNCYIYTTIHYFYVLNYFSVYFHYYFLFSNFCFSNFVQNGSVHFEGPALWSCYCLYSRYFCYHYDYQHNSWC